MPKIRIQQLSIYLLKSNISTATDAIRDNSDYEDIQVPQGVDGIVKICKKPSLPHPPSWLKFYPTLTQNEFGDMRTSSAGSVAFVTDSGRLFAVCFGTGWHLLKKDSFVRSFGLRAALRLIKDNTIKAADVSTYDNFAKYRRVSTSKGTEISTFDIEGQMDLLRGVFGECERPQLGAQIGGKDACVIWTQIQFPDISRLCGILLRASESKHVEHRFPVIKNISLIRDPSEIVDLDSILEGLLPIVGQSTHLAPPEVVNWEEVSAFKFLNANAPAPNITLSYTDILAIFAGNQITLQALKALEIATVRPDGTNGSQQWSAYDCIVTEIDDPADRTKKFILMAGDWYSVDSTFLGEVNTSIQAIPQHTQRQLPNANLVEVEKSYNVRFAASDSTNLTNLDAQNISYGGGRSKIEVCDVLSRQGCLYHIKDYSGSATLSHLFAQGTVSSRLILDQDFRIELGNKFGTSIHNTIPIAAITPSSLEVVYGVIVDNARNIPNDLPFFSKVRLMESVKELRRMGFINVSVIGIPRQ